MFERFLLILILLDNNLDTIPLDKLYAMSAEYDIENAEVAEDKLDEDPSELGMDSITFIKIIVSHLFFK